jgi:hypothetical protein
MYLVSIEAAIQGREDRQAQAYRLSDITLQILSDEPNTESDKHFR